MSKIIGGCRTLMAKAVTNLTATGAGFDRRGEIHKIFPVSESLARFVGQSEISFSTAMEKVKQYTDDHDLWNPENIEEILCDDNLKTIFDGKDKVVGVREMTELLLRHFPNVKNMSAKVKATGGATIEIWGFNDIVKVSEPLARFVGRSEISFVAALRKLLEYTV
ncbi:SWIB/MDM2 domain [Arabidopsis suecica]|uniref:SWIB/MDM2 domain n=1 Tax=Arabidopsis suecica TaxID=45249 RepID=A0A8T1ZW35_ARASU|nr:SWIB/MDM2 domain [Arabidopsis suecica]